MSEQTSGAEPKYGEWPVEALRELIRLKISDDPGSYLGSSRQSRLAMVVSQLTGCSYPWAWREIEDQVGNGPRIA